MDFTDSLSVLGAVALIALVISFATPSLTAAEAVAMHLRTTLIDKQSAGPGGCLSGAQRFRCEGTNILMEDCLNPDEPSLAKYCSDGCVIPESGQPRCGNPSGVPPVQARYW
ncbi:hypothetical protein HY641_03985 [Candidatus Woesearchaeota archaeon]|nr:hypothetical protein [Candidatus Woesearchaeota archaeon]